MNGLSIGTRSAISDLRSTGDSQPLSIFCCRLFCSDAQFFFLFFFSLFIMSQLQVLYHTRRGDTQTEKDRKRQKKVFSSGKNV